MKLFLFVTLVISVCASPSAWSEQGERFSDTGATKNHRVYDFEQANILGEKKDPGIGSIAATHDISFKRLLNVDESFTIKVIGSLDEF